MNARYVAGGDDDRKEDVLNAGGTLEARDGMLILSMTEGRIPWISATEEEMT